MFAIKTSSREDRTVRFALAKLYALTIATWWQHMGVAFVGVWPMWPMYRLPPTQSPFVPFS